jgi:hypothetical protein
LPAGAKQTTVSGRDTTLSAEGAAVPRREIQHMKTRIDNLVRDIQQNLAQPEPEFPELAAFFLAIGNDGHAKAVALRGILASYVDDTNLSVEVRQYARQQRDALPPF